MTLLFARHYIQASILLLIKLLAASLTFVFHYYLANSLVTAEYGMLTLALSSLAFFLVFIKQGVEQSVVKYLSPLSITEIPSFYSSILKYIAGNCLIFGGLLFFFDDLISVWLFNLTSNNFVWSIFILAIVQSIIAMNSAVFKSREQGSWALLFSGVITYSIVLLIFTSFDVSSAQQVFFFLSIAACIALILSVAVLQIKYRLVRKKQKNVHKYDNSAFKMSSRVLFWAGFCALVAEQSGVIIMAAYESLEKIAVYGVAQKISLLLSFPLLIANVMTAPKFARYHKLKMMKEIKELYKNLTLFLSGFAMLSAVIFYCFASDFMLFFGQSYGEGETLLLILVLGQLFNLCCGPVVSILVMSGFEQLHRKNMVFIAIFTVVALFIFVPIWGALAAALITTSSLILLNVMSLYFVQKRLFAQTNVSAS